jgi:hypothetical protein
LNPVAFNENYNLAPIAWQTKNLYVQNGNYPWQGLQRSQRYLRKAIEIILYEREIAR